MGAFRIRWPGEGRAEKDEEDGKGGTAVAAGGAASNNAPGADDGGQAGSMDAGASISTVETPPLSLDDDSVDDGGGEAGKAGSGADDPVAAAGADPFKSDAEKKADTEANAEKKTDTEANNESQSDEPEWVQFWDYTHNCVYYYNNLTTESSWEKPEGSK